MDTLLGEFSGSMPEFKFDHDSVSVFSYSDQNLVERSNKLSQGTVDPPFLPTNHQPCNSATSGATPEGPPTEEGDFSVAMYKYIGDILMEEDLEDKNCMLQDSVALLAAEKSFYDVLGEPFLPQPNSPQSIVENIESPDDNPVTSCSSSSSNSDATANSFVESDWAGQFEASYLQTPLVNQVWQSNVMSNSQFIDSPALEAEKGGIRGKKKQQRGDGYDSEERSTKQSALYAEECEPSEVFDSALLCEDLNVSGICIVEEEARKKLQKNGESKANGKAGRRKKQGNKGEVVDLRALLTQCAQALAGSNLRSANDLLKMIRQHSSPCGDGVQRLAHFFANSLEARLSGTGLEMSKALVRKRTPAGDIIKAYSSSHPDPAASKLRITGIDHPQPGFRPEERVEETGRRLANYCDRFNVPFEYKAIAQKWDTIRLEDLKIEKDEVVVVNCLYRLKNLLDETVVANSPRDAVLKLIREINPGCVHSMGLLMGLSMPPSSSHDQERMLFEREIFGMDIMNIIACEGSERFERPETYKQWQIRNVRAGLRQLPLDQEIVTNVRSTVKLDYHKDFVVDEDGGWMLQGWKGRIIYAISCWKPHSEL
ncbi:Scarecrow-like protein 33 [Vitis vinifera]|uniref:Scarecrow-like protein 33 n=1 Tax=Vitis vinifera TaxID=29760 RepID=A0A438G1D6_VITVI|nr:Scarecrow-like protein 33 [Vitis vinifera]